MTRAWLANEPRPCAWILLVNGGELFKEKGRIIRNFLEKAN